MSDRAIGILRRCLELMPDAGLERAALAELEQLVVADRERRARIDRVNARRALSPSKRLQERALVQKRFAEYCELHPVSSLRGARRWIAKVENLPPSRVRKYLEETRECAARPSRTVSEVIPLTEAAPHVELQTAFLECGDVTRE